MDKSVSSKVDAAPKTSIVQRFLSRHLSDFLQNFCRRKFIDGGIYDFCRPMLRPRKTSPMMQLCRMPNKAKITALAPRTAGSRIEDKSMDLESLLRDKISVLKSNDGSRIDGIKASVYGSEIVIMQSDPLIEPGDLIVRSMSNGGEETFEVIDPGFHEGLDSIPPGYKVKVRKLGLPDVKKMAQSITYNVHGSYAKINHQSIDNSINVVHDSGDASVLIAELRQAIDAATMQPTEKADAFELIDGVEAQFSSNKPKRSMVKAILSALPDVATFATNISALVSLAG